MILCVQPLSLSKMFLGFICINILQLYSFSWPNNFLLCGTTAIWLSVHLVDTWIVSIFLAIVNSSAMNIYIHFKILGGIYIGEKLPVILCLYFGGYMAFYL